MAQGHTDADGRLRDWVPVHGLRRPAATGWSSTSTAYLAGDTFFPEITVGLPGPAIRTRHYHVPLLLSRYGYTTYRGS